MIRQIHNMKNVTVSYEKHGKLIVGVEKKVPLQTLDAQDRIPKTLPDGRQTDVIVIPKIRFNVYCNQENYGCGIHAIRQRPIVGGISYAPEDSGAATLGMFVRDNIDDSIVALSCNHVIGPELGPGSTWPDYYVLDVEDVNLLQPSPLDGGLSPEDRLGTGKRAIGTIFGPYGENIVDAAIANLTGINLYTPGIQSLLKGGHFPFAEKYEYGVGNEVKKSGRTTGLSIGTISSVAANVTAILGADTPNNRAYYTGTIMVTSSTRFSAGGDSGSIVVCKIGGQWKIIGILFAGSSDGLTSFLCHISDVASLLDVSAWDGRIYMPATQTGIVLANGLCYYDTEEITAGAPTHSPQRTFSTCEDCATNGSKKTLFGNVL